jgi:hypothetical protein
MRSGRKIRIWDWTLVLDNTDAEWRVLRDHVGEPVARQRKQDCGRRFRQGTNPDYTGFLAYPLEWMLPVTGAWHVYSSDAQKGELTAPGFLERLAEHHGHKRPVRRTPDGVFELAKLTLQRFQVNSSKRVTKRQVRELVQEIAPGLTDHEQDSVRDRLVGVFC